MTATHARPSASRNEIHLVLVLLGLVLRVLLKLLFLSVFWTTFLVSLSQCVHEVGHRSILFFFKRVCYFVRRHTGKQASKQRDPSPSNPGPFSPRDLQSTPPSRASLAAETT